MKQNKILKIRKFYKISFSILGILSMLIFFLTIVYILGSLGHDFSPWGMRVGVNESGVSSNPSIPCLKINHELAQVSYNYIVFRMCSKETEGSYPSYGYFPLTYANGTVILYLNDQLPFEDSNGHDVINYHKSPIIANVSNNYTLKFYMEFKDNKLYFPSAKTETSSLVQVPLYIVDGTKGNATGLLLLFSPVVLLLVLFVFYLIHKQINPALKPVTKKTRRYGILSCIIAIINSLLFFLPYLPIILGIIGILLYYKQKKILPTGFATAGLIINIIVILINVLTYNFYRIFF